jgi:hypothetical protein
LAWVKENTLSPQRRRQIEGWVEQLGDDDFTIRRKALEALRSLGVEARPLLAQATDHPQPEIRHQAGELLESLPPHPRRDVLVTVIRQLGREPISFSGGTVPALLAFLADCEDTETRDYLARLLAKLGVRDGEAHPALLAGLSDRSLSCRLSAVEVLGRADLLDRRTPGMVSGVRKALLETLRTDPSQQVRFRAASRLLEARDREAIPALIQLLVPGTPAQREWIETRLRALAGDKVSPASLRGLGAEQRRLAWQRWWRANGATLDLARAYLPPTRLGYLLVALDQPGRATGGRVQEYDAQGRLRWEITGLINPVYAEVVGPDRVLICEAGETLTERNLQGEVVWRYSPEERLLSGRRLPNGHLLLFARSRVVELDTAGKEVSSLNSDESILAGSRDREGRTHLLKTSGEYELRDSSGGLIRKFSVSVSWFRNSPQAQFLPNGHLLVPDYSRNRVLEFDTTGRIVQEVSTNRPSVVHRLPNGNTLVSGRRSTIAELDPEGEEVRVLSMTGRVTFLGSR